MKNQYRPIPSVYDHDGVGLSDDADEASLPPTVSMYTPCPLKTDADCSIPTYYMCSM